MEGEIMTVRKIDDLIETSRNAMGDDFDLRAIYEWKRQAVQYLAEHLGEDHYYTQYFTSHMKEIEQKTLLTGGGLLVAAREEILGKRPAFRMVATQERAVR
jgi:hypothetical protein